MRIISAGMLVLLLNQVSQSYCQESAREFQQKSGGLIYRDSNHEIIGLEIPGYGNGWARSVVVDDSMNQWFDYSKPDFENDRIELNAVFEDAPNRLSGLTNFPRLKWIVYRGGCFWPLQPEESRKNEEARISVVIDAMHHLDELQGVLIYDSTIPVGGLEKIVSLEHLRAIALINCELRDSKGNYSRLPKISLMRTKNADGD